MSKKTNLAVATKQRLTANDYDQHILKLQTEIANQPIPSADELEKIIVGTILMEGDALSRISERLQPKHFFNPILADIYEVALEMREKNVPIDLVIMAEWLKKKSILKAIGGPLFLIGLTERIGSSANLEYHSDIVVEKAMYREGIELCIKNLKKFYKGTDNVYELRNDFSDSLRVMPSNSVLKVQTMDSRIEDGKNAPRLRFLAGSLIKESELSIIFAGPKRGKTIVATQIAEAISTGTEAIPGILINECEPKKVGFADFELSNAELFQRYSLENQDGLSYHKFNENFISITMDDNFMDFDAQMDKLIINALENAIRAHDIEVLFLDNLTWITNQNQSDPAIASNIMKQLIRLKKKYGITIVVLAHTKKMNPFMPITENELSGSMNLSNFASNTFAIGLSQIDPNLRYIKEVVVRNGEKVYDEHNVIECEIQKIGEFLQYKFVSMGREDRHLTNPNSMEDVDEILKSAAMDKFKNRTSYPKLFENYNIQETLGWTKRHFERETKKHLDKIKLAQEGEKTPF